MTLELMTEQVKEELAANGRSQRWSILLSNLINQRKAEQAAALKESTTKTGGWGK